MSDDQVKRYQPDYHHTQTYAEMVEDCDGDWVKYNDYKAASDRIEDLELAVRYLEAKLAGKEKLMLALAGDKIDLVSELAGVKGKLADLERWRSAAFIAHGNLDLDIEADPEALAELKG